VIWDNLRVGVPEEPELLRGDSNNDGAVDISDGIRIFNRLFLGDVPFACEDAADANDSGVIDLSDAIAVFGFLFQGLPPPPPPGPAECGVDPTDDALECAESVCS